MNSIQGTHARIENIIHDYELKWAEEAGTAWYRSKERIPVNFPYVGGGYLSNKKWPLNKVPTRSTINIISLLL